MTDPHKSIKAWKTSNSEFGATHMVDVDESPDFSWQEEPGCHKPPSTIELALESLVSGRFPQGPRAEPDGGTLDISLPRTHAAGGLLEAEAPAGGTVEISLAPSVALSAEGGTLQFALDPEPSPEPVGTLMLEAAPLPASGHTFGDELAGPLDPPRTPTQEPGKAGSPFGPYLLLERVGEGGMGVVFLAQDQRLNRQVAIKLMRGGALASKMRRRRFLREAEAAASLRHDNIVSIHEIGERGGYPYYSMDVVEGVDLAAYAAQHGAAQAEIARLVAVVADAVNHFHTHGIIHRDLKPDNVLVDGDGVPKIIDFGIAKRASDDESGTVCTVEGDVLGTPHFMPPEQASGNVQEVDTRSDVYALGAILYRLLGGTAPYGDLPAAKVLVAIQTDYPVPLRKLRPDVSPDLLAIVLKAMAKEVHRRYQSAAELANDLRRYLRREPILARPDSLPYRARKFCERRPGLCAGVVVATLALLSISIGLSWRARAQHERVESMLLAAEALPLRERPHHLSKILGLDPTNPVVQLRYDLAVRDLAEKRARAEDARLAEERRQREVAQAKLLQVNEQHRLERAEALVRASEAQAQARREAEMRVHAEAERRAEELLALARSARDPLVSIRHLDEAVGSLPSLPQAQVEAEVQQFLEGSGHEPLEGSHVARLSALRRRLAQAKLAATLDQVKLAVDARLLGLARYWLQVAEDAAQMAGTRAGLNEAQASLGELESGKRLVEEGLALLEQGEWLSARGVLLRARGGQDDPRLPSALEAVGRHCEREGARLLDEARECLAATPRRALQLSRAAVDYLADPTPARRMVEESAHRLGATVRLEVHRLFLGDTAIGRERALDLLRELGETVQGTETHDVVAAEQRARRRLVEDSSLVGLRYVPSWSGAERGAFLVTQDEVTNQAFARFVAAGGYDDPSLFDATARPLLASFLDASGLPGPRTWREGGYGDRGNAGRPVTGVSWYEARAYARWLSRSTGARWRLPTRAEWEVAAGWDPSLEALRAYPWGAGFAEGQLGTRAPTSAAGQNAADVSPSGLRDAGGNASEWVDCLGLDGASSPGLKGASAACDSGVSAHLARVLTTGRPAAVPPIQLSVRVGFRLVREIEED